MKAYKKFNLGPVYLEKKIEEVYGIHILHNTIQVLLKHDLVEEDMNEKKRRQRKWVRYERKHFFEVESDYCDWELAVDGIKTVKEKIEKLERLL